MSRRPRQALMRLRCWHTRTSRWICRISCMGTTFNACVVDLEAAGAWRRRACNTRCAPPLTCDRTWCCKGVARWAGQRVSADTGNEGRVVGDVSQCSTVLTYLIVCVQPAIHKQA